MILPPPLTSVALYIYSESYNILTKLGEHHLQNENFHLFGRQEDLILQCKVWKEKIKIMNNFEQYDLQAVK